MLMEADAGTGYMHEGFDPDNSANYTRPWFAWANSLFEELIQVLMRKGYFDCPLSINGRSGNDDSHPKVLGKLERAAGQ
jgi:hypothetical protein